MDATPEEHWLPIVGYEGLYEVSDAGRVRNFRSGLVLTPSRSGYRRVPVVTLCNWPQPKNKRKVHHLVLEAFVGPRPHGMDGLHWNDIPDDNRLVNLRWGTRGENQLDKVRNGNHHNAEKSHCIHGHEFTPENTKPRKGSGRDCRECLRRRNRDLYARKVR